MHKKELGQNFLTSDSVVKNLVNTANLTSKDVVLEIGAGEGIITKELVKQAKQVYAIEFDPDLIPILHLTIQQFNNVTIINDDVLKVLTNLGDVKDTWGVTSLVGSIPYQITSPLIHQIVTYYQLPATLLMQKEVAERVTAPAPNATYLSNLVAYWGEATLTEVVPKEVFDPVPKVDGAIVTFRPHHKVPSDITKFSKFLHLGFSNPRKMLNKVFDKELLLSLGIDPTRRAESLTLEDWKKIYATSLSN